VNGVTSSIANGDAPDEVMRSRADVAMTPE
jgi:hypothetical protein